MRRLAIMRNVRFGVRDTSRACLWFEADEGDVASLQILPVAKAVEILERYGIYAIDSLNGSPCWVESSGGTSVFVDLHVRKP